jgi:hypothetical protein
VAEGVAFDLNFVAVAWVKPVYGTYFEQGPAFYFTGTELLIKKMEGTLNGMPLPNIPGDPSWLDINDLGLGLINSNFGDMFQDPRPVRLFTLGLGVLLPIILS